MYSKKAILEALRSQLDLKLTTGPKDVQNMNLLEIVENEPRAYGISVNLALNKLNLGTEHFQCCPNQEGFVKNLCAAVNQFVADLEPT